jgi:pantoate kinase
VKELSDQKISVLKSKISEAIEEMLNDPSLENFIDFANLHLEFLGTKNILSKYFKKLAEKKDY